MSILLSSFCSVGPAFAQPYMATDPALSHCRLNNVFTFSESGTTISGNEAVAVGVYGPIFGRTLSMTATIDGEPMLVTPSTQVTSGLGSNNGLVNFSIFATKAGKVSIQCQDVTDPQPVTWAGLGAWPGASTNVWLMPSYKKSTFTIDKSTVNADGSDAAIATVGIYDINGVPVSNIDVSLNVHALPITISPGPNSSGLVSGRTGADGIASFYLRGNGASSGSGNISVITYSSYSNIQSLINESKPFSVAAPNTTPSQAMSKVTVVTPDQNNRVLADGSSTAVITFVIKNSEGKALANKVISLNNLPYDIVSQTSSKITTDADGKAIFYLLSSKPVMLSTSASLPSYPENLTLTVPPIEFYGLPSAEVSNILPSRATANADGQQSVTLTVIARTSSGSSLVDQQVRLILSDSELKSSPLTATTGADGKAIFSVTSIKSGTFNVSAMIGSSVAITAKSIVTFSPTQTTPTPVVVVQNPPETKVLAPIPPVLPAPPVSPEPVTPTERLTFLPNPEPLPPDFTAFPDETTVVPVQIALDTTTTAPVQAPITEILTPLPEYKPKPESPKIAPPTSVAPTPIIGKFVSKNNIVYFKAPKSKKVVVFSNAKQAMTSLRSAAVLVTDATLTKIPLTTQKAPSSSTISKQYSGQILMTKKDNKRFWYVDPTTLKRFWFDGSEASFSYLKKQFILAK